MTPGPWTRSRTATAALLALLLFMPLPALDSVAAQEPAAPASTSTTYPEEKNCFPPADGEIWTFDSRFVEREVICVGQTLVLHKIVIQENNNVFFYDMDITIDAHDSFTTNPPHADGVFIDGGLQGNIGAPGQLHVYDSLFRTLDRHEVIVDVLDNAVFDFINSTMVGFHSIGFSGGNKGSAPTPGGIGLIEDSWFYDFNNGIVVFDDAVVVRDNFFDGALLTALHTQGTPTFEGNTITNCTIGIEFKFDRATPTIRDNTITNCQAGIVQSASDAPQQINGNDVFWNQRCFVNPSCIPGNANFAGDATDNWWGSDPPDVSSRIPINHSPWRTSPVHPERLPTPIITGAPTSIHVGDSFILDGWQSQPSTQFNFPVTRYLWDFGDGTTTEGASVSHTYTTVGLYVVTLRAVDEKNLSHITQVQIDATNQAPTLDLAFQPDPPAFNQDLTVVPSSNDPEGDTVQHAYQWSLNGALQEDLTTGTVPLDRLNGLDTWSASVTATDQYGAATTKTTSIQVPNREPAIDSLSILPAAPDVTSSLTADATATDPDGHSTSLTYQWFRNDVEEPDLTGAVVPSHRLARSDTWAVRVTPNDGTDAGAPAETSIIIDNAEPTPTSVSLPNLPTTKTILQAVATGTDPDGDTLSWSFAWYRNDQLVPGESGDAVSASLTGKGESWRVVARPSDGDAEGESVLAEVVIQNTAPQITSLSFHDLTPGTGTDLVLDVSFVDADGDDVTTSIQWYQNEVLMDDLTTSTVSASWTAKGETWKAIATPNDGEDTGDSMVASVVIQNTPPAGSVDLPNEPGTEADLVASISVTDADGDAVTWTYTWRRDDAPTPHTGPVLNHAVTARGEEWTVHATPTDGEGEGPTVTATAVIHNTAPRVVELAFSPEAPTVETGLSTTATAADSDGDDITWTYQWNRNGVLQADLTTDTVPGNRLSKGDEWSVTATPTDDADTGNPSTQVVQIQNAAPQVTGLAWTSAPAAGDDLAVSVQSTDPDGDPVSYTYQWLENGEPTPYTGDSVPASGVDVGDAWRVTVWPSDAEDAGDPDFLDVIIGNRAPSLTVSLPMDARRGNDLVATVEASDPDNEPLTLSYEWSRTSQVTAHETEMVPGTALTKGDVWRVTVTASDGHDDVTAWAETTIQNTAPTLTNPSIDPTAGDTLTTWTVTSSASDVDDDPVTITYQWTRTIDDYAVQGASLPASETTRGETWTASATATDSDGASTITTTTITIGNAAPTLDIELGPVQPGTLDDVTATIEATDPDGDSIQACRVDWLVDAALIEQDACTDAALGHEHFEKDQEVQAVVYATDSHDASSTAEATVTVMDTAPTVTASLPEAQSGDALPATITVEDADGDPVTCKVEWFRDDASYEAGDSCQAILPAGVVQRGETWHLDVEATADGATSSIQSNTVTIQNAAPTIQDFTLPAVDSTQDLEASYTVQDLEGDELTCTQTWNQNGNQHSTNTAPCSGSASVPASETQRGDEWQLVLVVMDHLDHTQESTSITIENAAPTIVDLSLTSELRAGDSPQAAFRVSDADGDEVLCTLSWIHDRSGTVTQNIEACTNGENIADYKGPDLRRGDEVTAHVTAYDQDPGDAVAVEVLRRVGNTAPSIESATATAGRSNEGIQATVEARDADSDSLTCTFHWLQDNEAVTSTTSPCTQGHLDAEYVQRGEEWTFTVTANDGSDESSTWSLPASVVPGNSAPVLSGVSWTPSPAVPRQDIQLQVDFADHDGDPVDVKVIWRGPDGSVYEGLRLPGELSRAGTWELDITLSDGHESVSLYRTLLVENRAPSLTVTLNKPTPRTLDDVVATVIATDLDGDPVTVTKTWAGPDDSLAGETLPASRTSRGESWTFTATATDGTDTVTKAVTLTIQNTPPSASGVRILPASPGADEDLVATLTGIQDADDDPVSATFTWASSTGTTHTGATVPHSKLRGGSTWSVTAIPTDGTDKGAAVTASVVILAPDSDGDGTRDDEDNCPDTPNTGQGDFDSDGVGDACDGDVDGDGYAQDEEVAAGSSDRDAASTPMDVDGDGVSNDADACPGSDDGRDLDGDGVPDGCDDDVDGDGALNSMDEFPRDSSESSDGDGDGVGDNTDACPGSPDGDDLDGDGVPDGCDDDVDGDGVPNVEDAYPRDDARSQDDPEQNQEGESCQDCDDADEVLKAAELPEEVRVVVRGGHASLVIRLQEDSTARKLLVFRFSTPTLIGTLTVNDGQREMIYEAGQVPTGEHHYGVIGIQSDQQEAAVVAAVVAPSKVAATPQVTVEGIMACFGMVDSDGDGVCDEMEQEWGTNPAKADVLPNEPENTEGEPRLPPSALGRVVPMTTVSLVLLVLAAGALLVVRRLRLPPK